MEVSQIAGGFRVYARAITLTNTLTQPYLLVRQVQPELVGAVAVIVGRQHRVDLLFAERRAGLHARHAHLRPATKFFR